MQDAETHYQGYSSASLALSVLERWQQSGHPMLLVVPDNNSAERIIRDLEFFRCPDEGPALGYFPAWDVLPFDALSPSIPVSASRLHSLYLAQHEQPIIVASINALQQRILSPEVLRNVLIPLKQGAVIERESFLRTLLAGGYLRTATVEEYGQFAVRGSVIDIFPPGTDAPLRLEFFDEQLESIRSFRSATQRSFVELEHFDVLPVREILVGEELRRISAESGMQEALQRLRERAAELAVPKSKIERFEEAVAEGYYWPGLEHLQALISPELDSVLRYFPEASVIVAIDESALNAEADAYEELLLERAARAETDGRLFPKIFDSFFSADEVLTELRTRVSVRYDSLALLKASDLPDEGQRLELAKQEAEAGKKRRFFTHTRMQQQLQAAKHSPQPLQPVAEYIRSLIARRISTIVVARDESRQKRLLEILEGYSIAARGLATSYSELQANRPEAAVVVICGFLSAGFVDTQQLYAVISEREIFPDRKQLARSKQSVAASVKRMLGSLADLKEGDFVVHMDYGIGRYAGLRQKKVEGRIGDFLELVYAEESKLFLPVDALNKIQKYSGATKIEPKLTRLGGKVWEKAKRKVQEHVAALAGQLISTMAKRESTEGIAFGPLTAEDRSFADAFAFTETADQSKAIEEVLADMEKPKPMDRLVCGDVGYGKTEVAMRAAFKAVYAGKQVAVVVPTTVLARQHYESFLERFEGTGVRVGQLSRFCSKEENKRVIQGLASGNVDIVIGTHRVLQRDIAMADLGLLVIDEEHRFGVAHKERLKRFRAEIDVLTLSATPIPRTLHMSLVGIRDLSTIETAPANRQVIRTYLAEFDDAIVRESIMRELGRSGQVFFIHNRVQSIEVVAAEVQELVPEARIGIGHGQMKERELEKVMHQFINREIDVLVSTTIVESGLDIPNANTIIIKGAEHFGLAELYQLRGRVGRSSRRAYAYLLINNPTRLSRDARKRLEVLQSLDDLGVGFSLALQDMEIRGAGNLLGKDQSGHINAIGYELYSRILKDAIEQLRSEGDEAQAGIEIDPDIKIGFPIHIPPGYLPDVGQRLLLYQRLIEVAHERDIEEIAEEAGDRFGHLPEEVSSLFEYMQLRALARRHGIEVLRRVKEGVLLEFHESVLLAQNKVMQLMASEVVARITPKRGVVLALDWDEIESPAPVFDALRSFLHAVNAEFGSVAGASVSKNIE